VGQGLRTSDTKVALLRSFPTVPIDVPDIYRSSQNQGNPCRVPGRASILKIRYLLPFSACFVQFSTVYESHNDDISRKTTDTQYHATDSSIMEGVSRKFSRAHPTSLLEETSRPSPDHPNADEAVRTPDLFLDSPKFPPKASILRRLSAPLHPRTMYARGFIKVHQGTRTVWRRRGP
jgi:hypothetical protein